MERNPNKDPVRHQFTYLILRETNLGMIDKLLHISFSEGFVLFSDSWDFSLQT